MDRHCFTESQASSLDSQQLPHMREEASKKETERAQEGERKGGREKEKEKGHMSLTVHKSLGENQLVAIKQIQSRNSVTKGQLDFFYGESRF